MGYFSLCKLFWLSFVVPVFANMKQMMNIMANLVVKMTVTTKFVVTAATTKLVVKAVMTKLVLMDVTTKLVVTTVTTKLVVLAYFKEFALGW